MLSEQFLGRADRRDLGVKKAHLNLFSEKRLRSRRSMSPTARKKIVHGAVSMVEEALRGLSERKIVELDDERKAAMVSNLLVVLCSDKETQPIINTGTLYN